MPEAVTLPRPAPAVNPFSTGDTPLSPGEAARLYRSPCWRRQTIEYLALLAERHAVIETRLRFTRKGRGTIAERIGLRQMLADLDAEIATLATAYGAAQQVHQ